MLLALSGATLLVRPPTAAAQALGTMQVTARVDPAPAAWPTLAATAELSAAADTTADPVGIERGLARLQLEPGSQDARRVRIRVDFLRN